MLCGKIPVVVKCALKREQRRTREGTLNCMHVTLTTAAYEAQQMGCMLATQQKPTSPLAAHCSTAAAAVPACYTAQTTSPAALVPAAAAAAADQSAVQAKQQSTEQLFALQPTPAPAGSGDALSGTAADAAALAGNSPMQPTEQLSVLHSANNTGMVVNVGSVVGTLPEAAAGVELAAAALRALAGLKAKIDSFAAGSSLAASSSTDAGTDDDNNHVTGDGTDDGSDGVTADGIHCVDEGAVAAACEVRALRPWEFNNTHNTHNTPGWMEHA